MPRASAILSSTYNVRHFGAIGDGAHPAEDTAAFQAVYARCTSRGNTVIVPPTSVRYNLTADPWASIPSGRGGCTKLQACIETAVQVVIPREHRVQGMGRANSVDSSAGEMGSIIRAAASFPNDGTAIVRLGHPTEYSHGSQLLDLLVDGRGLTNVVGITAPTIQELSGIRGIGIFNVNSGLDLVADATKPAYNWFVNDLEIYLRTGSTGYGVDVLTLGGRNVLGRITVNSVNGAHIATALYGFRLRGVNLNASDLHAEHVPIGCQLGDTVAGPVTRGVIIDGLSGWDGSSGMTTLLKVPTVGYTDNYEVRALQMNGGVAFTTQTIIDDPQNTVSLLALEWPVVQFYRQTAAIYAFDTSYHNHVESSAFQNDTALTLPAGTSTDLNIKGAETLRLTVDAAGSAIDSILGYTKGRKVRIWRSSAGGVLTIKHNTGAGTAAAKIYCRGAADFTVATDEVLNLHYDFGPGNLWYAWKT